MKKSLLSFVLAVVCLTGYSQTNTPAAAPWIDSPVLDFLSRSNLLVVPYGVYDDGTHQFGGGIGLGYRVSEFLVPYLRFEQFGGKGWNVGGTAQLQVPIHLAGGKITIVPLFYPGIAVTSGTETGNDGNAVAILGTGIAIRFPQSDSLLAPRSLLVCYERWTGGGFNNNHWLGGLCWQF